MSAAATSLSAGATRTWDVDPVAESAVMREVVAAADDVAPTRTTVLLLGESGTGKEVFARYIHRRSPRCGGSWVAVNCAALPAELLESELFGHERGAFTGAAERRCGRIEQADGGTLLLDEISEMPLPLQVKLLRVLQEKEVDRVGGRGPVRVDIRIIATSNRDLADMARRGAFRADLYYRINVFPIVLPALRERREDIPALAAQLLGEAARELGRRPPLLSTAAVTALKREPFPGNVRELGNLLERALVRAHGEVLCTPQLGLAPDAPELRSVPDASDDRDDAAAGFPPGLPLELAALERRAITEALRRSGGNRTHAARMLGIGLRTLRNKLRLWRQQEADTSPAESAARRPLPGGSCLRIAQPTAGAPVATGTHLAATEDWS